MRLAVHAEWTKLRTVAGPAWLLLATAVLTAALSTAAVAAMTCQTSGCGVDAPKVSLTGVQLGQALVAVLAVLAVGGEYGTGMIHTTMAALPRRFILLAAKAATVTGPVLVAGAAGVLGSVLAGRLILPGNGFTAAHGYRVLSLADGATLRAAGGSVLYLALIALLALGVTVMVREPALAIGIVLGLLYLFPILIHVVSNPHWQRRLQQIAPSNAGLAVQATTGLHSMPIGPWPGLGVLALWALGALFAGGLLLQVRDA